MQSFTPPPGRRKPGIGLIGALGAAAVLLALTAGPAAAAGSGVYGQWSLSAGGSGSLTVPAAGFPRATVSTTSTGLGRAVGTGTSTYLNTGTAFGTAYGSSRDEEYLLLGTATGRAPSVTTLTFASPTPVGWGFALGDVDADQVQVSATTVGGGQATAAELDWEGSFNYCNTTPPRPSSCLGRVSSDLPVWNRTTDTLVGNGSDTNGASGWLRPTVPLTSLTLTFTARSGTPVYQLWVASPTTSVSGTVGSACHHGGPVTLALLRPDGSPVHDAEGRAVTATTRPDGGYAFERLAPGRYTVRLDVPYGYLAGQDRRPADTATGAEARGVDFALGCPKPISQPPLTVPPFAVSVDLPISPVIDIRRPVVITDPPALGTVRELRPGVLVYVPREDVNGTDSFVYVGRGRSGELVAVRVTVRVHGRDRAHGGSTLPDTGADPALPWLAGGATGLVLLGLAAKAVVRRRARPHPADPGRE